MFQWNRLISVLGALFVVIAVIHSLLTLSAGDLFVKAVVDFVLICIPGIALLYIGVWLPSADIDPELYPRIAVWVVGGIVVMHLFIFLRILHPGVSAQVALGTQAIAIAVGSIAGLTIGIRDAQVITRTRQLEAQNEELRRTRALEQHNEELRRTKAQLQEAVSQLELSNDQLEQFASVASHDLREPLRMVSSYLQLIETRYDDTLDDDGREFLTFAVDGADRMREMIEGLLEYSRIETQAAQFEVTDLNVVFDDVLTDLTVVIDETDAEITREPLPTVIGDGGQLRQVFQNLLHNAITYSDDRPRIHVWAEERRSAWAVSVHDDGIGIDPSDAERVFGLFRRLHTVDERPGSGIGLSVCKRIVERHGGRIWVESAPGDGSTFSFTIPHHDERRVSSAAVDHTEPVCRKRLDGVS